MRHCSLVTVLLFSACSFRAPRGIPVRVAVNVRADVHVQQHVDAAVVPLQGAPVNEFFGIPLADAHDLLFVLDVSGSMADPAEGQLALIPPPADRPPPPAAVPVEPPPSAARSGASPPPPPPPDAPPQAMGDPQGYPAA